MIWIFCIVNKMTEMSVVLYGADVGQLSDMNVIYCESDEWHDLFVL